MNVFEPIWVSIFTADTYSCIKNRGIHAAANKLLVDIRLYFGDLKIEVKKNWQVFPVDSRGIDFLGYVFYHTHTRMRKSIKLRFCRKLARLNKQKSLLPKKHLSKLFALGGVGRSIAIVNF